MAWTRREFVVRAAAAGALGQVSAALGQTRPTTADNVVPSSIEITVGTYERAGQPATVDGAVNVTWLDPTLPAFFSGATWGVPWPKGTVKADATFAIASDTGEAIAAQTWPLATWPDGSLKWTAHAVGPQATMPTSLRLRVRDRAAQSGSTTQPTSTPSATPTAAGSDRAATTQGATTRSAARLTVRDANGGYEINTGPMTVRLAGLGKTLFASIKHGDKEVAVDGQLVGIRQDGPSDGDAPTKREALACEVGEIAVEQNGPVRAVVKLCGTHVFGDGRKWLPFCVRLYFYAGSDVVRVMHTFIFDGDENKDFLAGLGVRFGVPMTDELHNRHVRFVSAGDEAHRLGTDGKPPVVDLSNGESVRRHLAGPRREPDAGGVWGEAVRGITGLRRDPGEAVRTAQVAGRATPPLSDWAGAVRDRINLIPAWGDHTLAQLSADGFEIRKRTKPGHGWIKSDAGTRAAGVGYVGGASGGVAFGQRYFWERHPTQLDVRNAHTEKAEVTCWLYSPEAPAMDLRFYHDGMGMDSHPEEIEGLNITYEDYEKGFGTPHGVARTNELFLWAQPATPTRQRLLDFARSVTTPPVLACAPAHLATTQIFGGLFAPPDRSTPVGAAIEDANDLLIDYYQRQVEDRRWYGFWDHGDVMHTYDADRHVWRYDVGGYAWDNSELSPDLWLWYSFLRSGDAKLFRFAEAMTRHTGEVDVYHLGRFKGLGSRHNVMHWGCSAKQLRISTAIYRRFYYFLTGGDERVGELMREQVDSDETFLTLDPIRKIRREEYKPDPKALAVGPGTDFSGLASAWLTEYERTGDKKLGEKIRTSMRTLGEMPFGWFTEGMRYDMASGAFFLTDEAKQRPSAGVSHLAAVFGLLEICAELIQTFDVPEFEQKWLQYCELYNAPREERTKALNGQDFRNGILVIGHSRLTAYAAHKKKDERLARRAWAEFFGSESRWAPGRYQKDGGARRVGGPDSLKPIDEIPWVSTNDASQWGLAAVQNLALVPEAIPKELPIRG